MSLSSRAAERGSEGCKHDRGGIAQSFGAPELRRQARQSPTQDHTQSSPTASMPKRAIAWKPRSGAAFQPDTVGDGPRLLVPQRSFSISIGRTSCWT